MKPAISFVVPVFNKVTYIAQCLKSLQNQTVKNIEIVVVDDSSTDESVDVVRWFKNHDDRVRWFKFKENKGRSATRNYGNKFARANIICVQDADDLSVRERARVVLDTFAKYPEIDIFYSAYYVIDTLGKVFGLVKSKQFNINDVRKDFVTYIGHSTMAYKKRVANNVKYMDGEFSRLGLDDFKLQIDCYRYGYKFRHCKKPLVMYRPNDTGICMHRNKEDVRKVKEQCVRGL